MTRQEPAVFGNSEPPSGSQRSGGLTWNLASAMLPMLGSLLVSLFLAPYLGDRAWGEYSLVLSAATLLLILAKFGVHSATSRLVTEFEEDAGTWLRAGLGLRSLCTLVTALLALAATKGLARSFGASEEAFWFVAPVVVAASYYEFGGEVLVGLRRYPSLLVTRVAYLALRLAAVLVVRLGGLGVVAFLAGHALAQVLPALGVNLALWRGLPVSRGPESSSAFQRTWQLSVPLAFSSASYLIFAHTDRLMLGWFHDPAIVGQFSVARNVLDAALFPLTALAWSLRPALSRALMGRDGADAPRTLADGTRLAVLYAIAGPALLWVFGPGLLVGLYTPAYSEAANLLRWMLPILALRGLGAILFPALLAADAQHSYAKLMVWTALANVLGNLALIPPFGARGAIAATLLSLVPLTVGGFLHVRRRYGSLGFAAHRGAHLRALITTAGGAGVAGWLLPDQPSLPLWIAAAALTTGLVLLVNLRGARLR